LLSALQLPLLLLPDVPNGVALLALALGGAALTVVARKLGDGSLRYGGMRRDANLIATLGEAPIRCWLVAHLDTKAQGHSMAGRLVAVWAAVVAVLALVVEAVTRLASGRNPGTTLVVSVSILGLIAGRLAARGRLRGESAGARDNATGVLAALVAAGALKSPNVGLIVTGAEEFGLVGARALAREEPELLRNADVINLDTLCDRGRLYILAHLASGLPLARRIAAVVEPLGVPVEIRRLPLGILTDSLAFAPLTGAITLSRLDWSVLRVMHTPNDVAQGLDPGFAEALGQRLSDAYPFDTIPGPP
jgi:hypothetical protein